jgi:methyltransferase (TIGR00027 family)
MNKREDKEEKVPSSQRHSIPFTARLTAYHRAQETKRGNPLVIDPFAERLAGDLTSYDQNHRYTTRRGDYSVIRSYYIEEKLLKPWCNEVSESEIVLLGAGLDSRAYRFKPLKRNKHTVYEVDFPAIINYKEAVLHNEDPLCNLVRISADLSEAGWYSLLPKNGFSNSIPSFWILEGLLYYLPKDRVVSVLKKMAEISHRDSRIFADVCEPALAEGKFGAFLRNFQWGIAPSDVACFFRQSGWTVSWSYAHKHDQGRDVGQRGQIFVQGEKSSMKSASASGTSNAETPTKRVAFPPRISIETLREIEDIVDKYREDSAVGFHSYLDFIEKHKDAFGAIIEKLENPQAVSHISPRLLRNPLYIENLGDMNKLEREAHVTGYLRAILRLIYWNLKRIDSWKMPDNLLQPQQDTSSTGQQVESLLPLIWLVQEEYCRPST